MSNINTQVDLDLSSDVVQNFLFDKNQIEYLFDSTGRLGFSLEEERTDEEGSSQREQEMRFQIVEHWRLERKYGVSPRELIKVNVIVAQKILLKVAYKLYLKNDIDDAPRNRAIQLFEEYDSDSHGEDISAWVSANLSDGLNSDMFVVETTLALKKIGDRYDVRTEQRDALLEIYGEKDIDYYGSRAMVNMVPGNELFLTNWLKEMSSYLSAKPVGEELPKNHISRFDSQFEHTLGKGEIYDDEKVDKVLDKILPKIIPAECGEMRDYKHRLLTLGKWPEFRILWDKKTIKIGCAKITIHYPIFEMRIANLVFYVYYALPHNVGATLLKIASACAIRSALGASVVGIVVGNPAAAAASFKPLFKRCISKEIRGCIEPGLLKVKEIERGWS